MCAERAGIRKGPALYLIKSHHLDKRENSYAVIY